MAHGSDQETSGTHATGGLDEQARHTADEPRSGSEPGDLGAEAKEKARELAGEDEDRALGARARETTDELRVEAEEKARELGSRARHKIEEAGQAAGRSVTEGASRAGERLRSVAGALRAASDRLDEEGEGWLAGYARGKASQVDQMSGYLGRKDAGRMMSDLEEKARVNPAAFLGGTLATGFVVGRFLRSSGRRSHTPPAGATSVAPRETGGEAIMPSAMPPSAGPPIPPHERRAHPGAAAWPPETERREPVNHDRAGAP